MGVSRVQVCQKWTYVNPLVSHATVPKNRKSPTNHNGLGQRVGRGQGTEETIASHNPRNRIEWRMNLNLNSLREAGAIETLLCVIDSLCDCTYECLVTSFRNCNGGKGVSNGGKRSKEEESQKGSG